MERARCPAKLSTPRARDAVNSQGMDLVLPHPINFALQKLIISNRRSDKEKRAKDRLHAIEVLREVLASRDEAKARSKFRTLPPKWKKSILSSLKAADADDVGAALQ